MGAAATAASAALGPKKRYEAGRKNSIGSSDPMPPPRFSSRSGLTPEEKDALDAAEEPMVRRYADMNWNCHQCGVALLDVWGETLCHACHKRNDPYWREAKAFTKPVVVYAKVPNTSKSEAERRRNSMGHGSPLAITVTDTEGGHERRSSSKGGQSLDEARSRSASKTSLAIQDDMSRAGSKQASHAGDSEPHSRKPSHSAAPEPVSRASSKHDHTHTKSGIKGAEPDHKEEKAPSHSQPAAPALPPPPFSEFQGEAIDLVHKKHHHHHHHHGDDKDGHHHHRHHHHHHHDHEQERKNKRQSQEESMEMLASLKDERGHQLQMGDRVIGEGKIGEDMGMGTVTGANTSHGHGMVIVQYDTGHSHPMKAEHLRKLEPREEADVLRKIERAKKERNKKR